MAKEFEQTQPNISEFGGIHTKQGVRPLHWRLARKNIF